MAGKFWYPHHWSDFAHTAFKAVDGDHDSHGLSPDFIGRQEDRDRYLEDFLGNIPLPLIDFHWHGTVTNAEATPPFQVWQLTQVCSWTVIAGTVGTVNCTFTVYVDGTAVQAFILPAGDTTIGWQPFYLTLNQGDVVSVVPTLSAGSGQHGPEDVRVELATQPPSQGVSGVE